MQSAQATILTLKLKQKHQNKKHKCNAVELIDGYAVDFLVGFYCSYRGFLDGDGRGEFKQESLQTGSHDSRVLILPSPIFCPPSQSFSHSQPVRKLSNVSISSSPKSVPLASMLKFLLNWGIILVYFLFSCFQPMSFSLSDILSNQTISVFPRIKFHL